jgi:hypothetical protein
MAEQTLGLNRQQGWEYVPGNKHFSVQIDKQYAEGLSQDRLNKPGLVLDYGSGQLVIDGNHRLARRYMDGLNDMEFIVIPAEELGKILIR